MPGIEATLDDGVEVEVWWQDEARVGQKEQDHPARGKTRHQTVSTQGPEDDLSLYLRGHLPEQGQGLVMPCANTEALNAHLAEIGRIVEPGAHAVVMLDRAGWHTSLAFEVPDNITLLPLPPRAPERNPVENVWQFMRENGLSNRVFKNDHDILDHCCQAWNKLVSQPEIIASIRTPKSTHGFQTTPSGMTLPSSIQSL